MSVRAAATSFALLLAVAGIGAALGGAGVARADKVEEVNLDDLDDDKKPDPTKAHEHSTIPAANLPQQGKTVVEEVKPEELEETTFTPEYDRRRWLLALPVLCLLVVLWNVDWREARVKAEISHARASRAPKVKKA
jgi:hypothetical protein